ncbi:MAG: PmoA family protein, partial [Planctomycetes bacterium]|nr:PmoA family protein [Planctomycetota bacterium]
MPRLLGSLALILLVSGAAPAEKFTVEQSKDAATVLLDGKLFTRYLTRSGAKPVLYPLIGPGGAAMTRAYPLEDARPGERTDHVHQRSFWFTHDKVNGVGFWHENENHGTIVHREFVKAEG